MKLAIMGRGKDLTNNERATVHTLMKKNWNYEQNQFKHKGRSLTLKECGMYGVRLSEQSLKRYARIICQERMEG